ncbi:MAG TPA: DUF5801 repeats-in-toxin domain-containing protein, partial [Devosia sp.]|nr:DUF5801 repeats-in-toxin domain-containing protein [Devosia sp.]
MTENYQLDSGTDRNMQNDEPLLVAQVENAGSGQATVLAAAPPAELVIAIEGDDVVRLPANASIDAPRVNGDDLEFVQPDGSVIVVPGGTVQGLTIFIGTVEIPPQTVAALFAANDIQAAAGPAGAGGPGSSGGNFEVPVGNIGQALPFGSLLPPTALFRGNAVENPLYAGLLDDSPTAGTNAFVQGDDDDLAFGLAGGIGDDASGALDGTLAHDYGRNGVGSVLLTGVVLPVGLGLSSVLTDGGRTLTIGQDGVDVLRITLADTTSGSYTIEQLAAFRHPEGDDENNIAINITYRVADRDGDFVDGALTIDIDDDSPIASSTSATILDDEGATANTGFVGNEGGLGDISGTANIAQGHLSYQAGADGLRDLDFAGLDGTTAAFKSIFSDALGASLQEAVRFEWDGASHTLKAIGDVSGNAVFTLVIDDLATGHFTLTLDSALVHSDVGETQDLSIILPFTVTDGDGDTATASLLITANDDMPVVNVSPATNGVGHATPLSLIQLNLDETFDGTAGGDDRYTNAAEAGAGDNNGDLDDRNSAFGAASLTTDVAAAADKAFGQLSTAPGQQGGVGGLASLFDSSVALGADGGTIERQFALTLSGTGAGGAKPAGVQTTLIVTDVTGTPLAHLSEAQRTVYLFQEADGSMTGRIGGADGFIALRITLTGTGDPSTAAMTVQQLIPLEHGNIALHDEQVPLQLVGVNGDDVPALSIAYTITAIDGDGDVVTQNASVVLADANSDNGTAGIVFDDDGPTLTASLNGQFELAHDETLLKQGDANDLGIFDSLVLSQRFSSVSNPGHDPSGVLGLPLGFAQSAGSVLAVSAVDYGSDGAAQAGALVYTFSLTVPGGAASVGPIDSGLMTTEHKPIALFLEQGLIVGRYDADGDGVVDGSEPAAFALQIDSATGHVALVQYVSLEHPTNPNADEAIDLSGMNGQINATLTATDGDGDTATFSADISAIVRFQDDGPALEIFGNRYFKLTADESVDLQADDVTGPLAVFAGVPDAAGTPLAYATDSAAAIIILPYYGVDGPASSRPLVYQLQVGGGDGAASGLSTTNGSSIALYTETDGTHSWIVGRVVGGPDGGKAAFAVTIDPASGQLSVVQYLSIEHPNHASSNELISIASGKIAATVTITDGDGDSVTKTLDLSGKIGFRDDGPTLVGGQAMQASVDEDGLHAPALSIGNADDGRDGEETGNGSATASGTLNALVDFGADGFGSFGLKIVAPVDSGLESKNQAVLIASDGTTLYGYVEGAGGAGYQVGDRLVFMLTLAADGTYIFTLNDQIDHPTLDGLAGDNSENLLAAAIDLSGYIVATDGDGDSVSLANGMFTIDVLDDIPVVTARDAVTSEITHTVTTAYTLQAGNTDIRGMDGKDDFDIRLTGVDLKDKDDTVNTTGSKIGIGDGQRIDGEDGKGGPEILTLDFIKNFTVGSPAGAGSYDVNAMRFIIDVHKSGTSNVFLSARNDGAFVDFEVTVNGVATAPLHPVYVGGVLVGYTFSVPDDAVVVATGKAGAQFDSFDIGNYTGHQFDSSAGAGGNVTLSGGDPFKVYGIESDKVVTETLTETFKISHDETAGVNTAADPNIANDVVGADAPAALAGAFGYAHSAASVLAAGGLFVGTVGADEDGQYSFAITDKDGKAINDVSSGLTTIGGLDIMLSTAIDGTLIGSAGGQTVFKVHVAADGVVWIAQYQAIAHTISGDGPAAYDDVARVLSDLHVTAALTDADGDAVSQTSPVALQVEFQDDGPKLNADVDSIVEDSATAATGNVITGQYSDTVLLAPDDGNATNGFADVIGADGLGGIAWLGDGGSHVIDGEYGRLSVDAAGNYAYHLYTAAENLAGYQAVQKLTPGQTLTEQFDYVVTDGDGDTAQSNLTITVNGIDDGVTIQGIGTLGGDVIVDESGLAWGSDAGSNSEIGTGSFTFEAPDGLKSVTIGGTVISAAALNASGATPITVTPSVDEPDFGVLQIIGFTPSATGGTVSYRFVLTDNLTTHTDTDPGTLPHGDGDGNSGADDQIVGGFFTVTVTDSDDSTDTAKLYIAVNDDVPLAGAANTQVADENTTATGTLGFVPGADSGQITHVNGEPLVFDPTDGWSQTFYSADGHLQVKANGEYQFTAPENPYKSGVNQFAFTITDADNDTVQTVLSVIVNDTVTTNFITLDDVTVLENGTITYTAHMDYAAMEPVTVTLSNDVVITFAPGKLTATSDPQQAQGDDVYQDGTIRTITIESVAGGNFEDIDRSDTAQEIIQDTINPVTAALTATHTTSEDSGSISYTVTLSGAPGAIDPDTDLVFNLSNNVQVTILAGQTTGTATVPVNDDDVYSDTKSIDVSIIDVASGGTEYEKLVIDNTVVSTEITNDTDIVLATLTAGEAVFGADGVTIAYSITLTSGMSPFTPTGGAPLTFKLAVGGAELVIPDQGTTVSKAVFFSYAELGGATNIVNSIGSVTGDEEYEKLVAGGQTTTVVNTTPSGGGNINLTLSEAALDQVQDPADLHAGNVTGSNPASGAESVTATSGITFTTTGEAITVGFADPAGADWVAPAVAGLATGYSIDWSLSGGQLVGTLMQGLTNHGPAIYLSLAGTSAAAGASVTPKVTVTLVDSLEHASGNGSVTIIGVKVVATDSSGDTVSGSVDLTVADDAPTIHSIMNAFMANEVGSVTGVIDTEGGADGIASYHFSSLGGLPADWAVTGIGTNALTVMDNVGTKIYDITAQPDGTYTIDQAAARPGTSETIQAASLIANSPAGAYDLGFATFTPLTSGSQVVFNANTNNSVPGGHEFGVGNTAFTAGESFRVDFEAAVSNFTLGIGTLKTPGQLQFILSDDDPSTDDVPILRTIAAGSTSVMIDSPDFDFTHVTVLGFDPDGPGKTIDVTFTTASYTAAVAASDLTFTIGVVATDGDGDTSAGSFAFVSDGSATLTNTITGLASNDVIAGLAGGDTLDGAGGNDILTGGHGDDILIGGLGDDTLIGGAGVDTLTSGAGNDVFVLDSFDAADIIADYQAGDKVDLTALFTDITPDDPSEYVQYDSTTGVLQVDADGAGGASTFQT